MAPLRLQGANAVFAAPGSSITGSNLSTASSANGAAPKPTVLDRAALTVASGINDIGANSSLQVLRYPIDTPMYYMTMAVHDYKRADWRSIGTLNIIAAINLALPNSLIDNIHIDYDPEPVGAAIGLGWEAISGGMANQSLQQIGADLVKAGTAVNAEKLLGGLGAGARTAALAASGLALNNFLTVMLKGPSYKKRIFQWRFSAKSAQESEQLRLIQNLINNSGAPILPPGAGSAFFKWPRIFKIQFRYATGIDVGQYTFRMKPMVLTNAAWNYTPNGQPAFFAGTRAPEGIEVMLEFLELEYWLQGDYGKEAGAVGTPNFPASI